MIKTFLNSQRLEQYETGMHTYAPGTLHRVYGFVFSVFKGLLYVNKWASLSCAFPWAPFLLFVLFNSSALHLFHLIILDLMYYYTLKTYLVLLRMREWSGTNY